MQYTGRGRTSTRSMSGPCLRTMKQPIGAQLYLPLRRCQNISMPAQTFVLSGLRAYYSLVRLWTMLPSCARQTPMLVSHVLSSAFRVFSIRKTTIEACFSVGSQQITPVVRVPLDAFMVVLKTRKNETHFYCSSALYRAPGSEKSGLINHGARLNCVTSSRFLGIFARRYGLSQGQLATEKSTRNDS